MIKKTLPTSTQSELVRQATRRRQEYEKRELRRALDAGVFHPGNAQVYSDLLWAPMHGLAFNKRTTRLHQALVEAPRLIERGVCRR